MSESEAGGSDLFVLVADLVTEAGKPLSITSSPAPREVVDSLENDLIESFDVRALFIHKEGGSDE